MSENSKIEWTDHTFNPWEGCQKVGPGCDHCYAEARNARFAGGTAINWGPDAPRRRTSASNWAKPRAWNDQAGVFMAKHGRRQRVFCASLADVFDNAVDPAWRADLFALIQATPALDWLLLTKRIGNVHSLLPEHITGGELPNNVWLGATITSQAEADRDIPKLLSVPARVRFLSMEPLLGPVDLERPRPGPDLDQGGGSKICQPWLIQSGIDWVIVGGESGPGARPMHPDWARSLRDQCAAAGVPYLFKQWGEWLPGENEPHPEVKELNGSPRRVAHHQDGRWGITSTKVTGHNYVTWDEEGVMRPGKVDFCWPVRAWAERVGKKAAGRLLDGRTWDEFPAP
ncbi:MAG: phage Gp37/Gp68 family protein [Caldilineaceae bacterium]|nr:phage Gp37/Gp68 family protein [Caldilineaceae bacterium]